MPGAFTICPVGPTPKKALPPFPIVYIHYISHHNDSVVAFRFPVKSFYQTTSCTKGIVTIVVVLYYKQKVLLIKIVIDDKNSKIWFKFSLFIFRQVNDVNKIHIVRGL